MSIIENELCKTPTANAWKNIGMHPHHGIALPLSALHSKESCGIGEFQDLKKIIDWCHDIGLDTVQLLPLNDTGDDISPYSAISSCALDPVYLSLYYLFPNHKELSSLQELNTNKRIAYNRVKKKKLIWLQKNYKPYFTKVKTTASYHTFCAKSPWLEDYGLYRVLLEKHDSMPWTHWSTSLQNPSKQEKKDLYKKHRKQIDFYKYLQYLCFEEMLEIKRYAEQKKVFLKGDIPILLSANSVDVWANKDLFILDQSAGAPPDMYSAKGQDWGFPLFNWEELKKTDYAWWKQRLQVTSLCFHMYRIDHIVGFFRIWSVDPSSKKGKFISKNRHLWRFEGKERLEVLIASSLMLPIAEDLGTIPGEVHALLRELGICGMRVMRWQRYWEEDGSYIPIENYEPLSLTTVSTHDSETLAQWWEKYPSDAKDFCTMKNWSYEPTFSLEKRKELLYDAHHSASLFHINPLQEYLALFPELVSENIDEERINIPGKHLKTNWTYRFRPSLEKILSHQALRKQMQEILNLGDTQ